MFHLNTSQRIGEHRDEKKKSRPTLHCVNIIINIIVVIWRINVFIFLILERERERER